MKNGDKTGRRVLLSLEELNGYLKKHFSISVYIKRHYRSSAGEQ